MKRLAAKIVAFAKRHWIALFGSVLSVLALAGLVKSLRERNEARLDAETRRRIGENADKISALRELRAEALGRSNERGARILALDARIASAQREVVAAHDKTEGLTDDEVVQRFRSLGYH